MEIWKRLPAPGGPAPRSSHCTVAHDGHLYVFGGLGTWRHNDLWRLDLSTGSWEELPCKNPPEKRSKSAIFARKGAIYIWGGWGAGARTKGKGKMSDMWKCTIGSWEWSEVKQTSPPSARSSMGGLLLDENHYYMFGGIGDNKFQDAYIFTFSTGAWKPAGTKGGPPGKRSSYGGIHRFGDTAYIFGGLTCGQFNDVWALDLPSLTWRQVETTGKPPKKRGRHACAILGPYLMVFGGTNLSSRFGDTRFLDLRSNQWTPEQQIPHAPAAREAHTLVEWGGMGYLFAGMKSGGGWLNDLYALNPEAYFSSPPAPEAEPVAAPAPQEAGGEEDGPEEEVKLYTVTLRHKEDPEATEVMECSLSGIHSPGDLRAALSEYVDIEDYADIESVISSEPK